jgi:hypothetical protein
VSSYYNLDYKNLDFSNSAYQRPFIREVVIKDFVTQAEKYLATGNPVIFQFSQPPPSWLAEVLESLCLEVDVFFFVAP